ncbi:MAG: hypothetical protein IJV90_04625, partial [Candidatus Methanomethylophilaceae archaeon]|nr:hypothetical protein [Candidatus Methanomethylophilaceae archaeon]
ATMTITTGTIYAIVVEGTVDVDGTATITTATVMGTIDGDATATVTTLYAGVMKNNIIAANAVIGDKVALASNGVAYVAPGTTVNETISAYGYTEFYVEDALYLTVYVNGATVKVTTIKTTIDNADFLGWMKNGKLIVNTTTPAEGQIADFNIGGKDKVYASVDYKIFKVAVNTVPGTVVYIDGTEWNKTTEYAAGSHTIAVYLEAGYEGTPVINVNGTTVTDSFTISGEETVITVSGVTAATGSGTIVIQPSEPTVDKDEGMDLTDILLIGLVVLIVIMAIIVALRMMRS